jgi:hypothetical protein
MSEAIQHNAANILAISKRLFTGVISTQAKLPALHTLNRSKDTAICQVNTRDESPMRLTAVS